MAAVTDDDPSTLFVFRKAHAGDRASLEELLQRVRLRLESWVAARLGDDCRSFMDVDDLVQEILVKAYARIETFDPVNRKAFYGWIFKIARNTLIDSHKAAHARKRDAGRNEPLRSSMIGTAPTPSAIVSGDEERERALLAIAGLPENYRRILSLRRLEGKSTAEAAEAMGITKKNTTVLLTRARKALTRAL